MELAEHSHSVPDRITRVMSSSSHPGSAFRKCSTPVIRMIDPALAGSVADSMVPALADLAGMVRAWVLSRVIIGKQTSMVKACCQLRLMGRSH